MMFSRCRKGFRHLFFWRSRGGLPEKLAWAGWLAEEMVVKNISPSINRQIRRNQVELPEKLYGRSLHRHDFVKAEGIRLELPKKWW